MSTLFGKQKRKRNATKVSSSGNDLQLKEGEARETEDYSKAILEQKQLHPATTTTVTTDFVSSFDQLGLASPLVATCKSLGFKKPTPVQRTVIPFLLREESSHLLALASTGSGKTASFVLPIIHKLVADPYGIYAVILTPTRELAKQINQQVLALGASYKISSSLVIGGLNPVQQSIELESKKPHFCVATPGRLAELLRGPNPPRIKHIRFIVLDEADRLLAPNSGFERDVAELLLHSTTTKVGTTENEQHKRQRRQRCQTLLFSATLTRSLKSIEELAGAGLGRLPLRKFVIRDDSEKASKKNKRQRLDIDSEHDNGSKGTSGVDGDDHGEEEDLSTPQLPSGLKQEYVFMPSRVRDAYLLTTIRTLMTNGGRHGGASSGGRVNFRMDSSGWTSSNIEDNIDDIMDDGKPVKKARSAIIFVSTCERAALVSGILSEVGVANVALHSLLTQNRRLAALGKFKSQQVRILVATDVASRGLDIPTVDLVLNSELPRRPVDYIHRVGRTARAGRRGRAISFISEGDLKLVEATERLSGRKLDKCVDITDDMAIKMLGPITKASRLAKMKLMDIGFDELVKKMKERKVRDRKERERIERKLKKQQ